MRWGRSLPTTPGQGWSSECWKISFATPSPRLIPEGEKPDSFTGLALAPNEGRTWKGAQ